MHALFLVLLFCALTQGCTLKNLQQPNVTITYDDATSLFEFVTDVVYVRDETIWAIDFTPFSSHQLFEPNSCQNRQLLLDSFPVPTMADLFVSANDSQQPDALGSKKYLAYGPAKSWLMSAPTCQTVRFVQHFSFDQLLSCTNENEAPLVTYQPIPLTNLLMYSGTLYVSAVRPVWHNASKLAIASFQIQEYAFPFSFKFGSTVQNVRVYAANTMFAMSILQIKLNAESKLQATIRTETLPEQYLSSINLETMPFDAYVQVVVSNQQCNSAKCYQEWVIVSKEALSSYKGTFEISWQVCAPECAPAPLVYGQMTVHMDVVERMVGQYNMNTKTKIFRDWTEETYGPFRAGEQITAISTLNTREVDAFSLVLLNAWICYSSTPAAIRWEPENGHYGCAKTEFTMSLVRNGAPSSANSNEQSFGAKIFTINTLPWLKHASMFGLSFNAHALTFQDALYFLHLECQVVPLSNSTSLLKRNVQEEYEKRIVLAPLYINAAGDEQTLFAITFLTFGMAIGGGMLLLFGTTILCTALVCVCIAKRESSSQ